MDELDELEADPRPGLSVPVVVRSQVGVQFGWVRGLSRWGAVIEIGHLPPLNSELEVTFELWDEHPATAAMKLTGRIRHIRVWQTGRRRVRQVGLRWGEQQTQAVLH